MKAQYSIEFLYTYGWALLILLVVIGGLVTFGAFDFENSLPTKCSFFGQIVCKAAAYQNTNVSLELTNDFGTDLVIYDMQLVAPGKVTCAKMPFYVVWNASKTVVANITGCAGSMMSEKELKAKVNVTYYRNHSWCQNGAGAVDENCLFTALGELQIPIN